MNIDTNIAQQNPVIIEALILERDILYNNIKKSFFQYMIFLFGSTIKHSVLVVIIFFGNLEEIP
jgi:hypothetical protein